MRIGARGSKLSQAQTKLVADLLISRVPGLEIEIVPIRTAGDRLPPEKRKAMDGKTAFTGDIQSSLLLGDVDAAVHSMKDLSVEPRDGLMIGATPPRGDPRDALISIRREDLQGLRAGATIGTSSLRRKAQLLSLRADLCVVDLHGNVESRIERMSKLGLDAVVLAAAGLQRMSRSEAVSQFFSVEEMVPAVGQATLAVEVRKHDGETRRLVEQIDDAKTRTESECERAFARTVGGDCFVPVGACARANGSSLSISGIIASPDGRDAVKKTLTSPAMRGESLGRRLGEEMLQLGGDKIIRSFVP